MAESWRLGQALNAPGWLTVDGNYRLRFEALDNPYRAGAAGSDQILVERLIFGVRGDFENYYAGVELEDSRSQLDDAGTPLGTDDVNALELLRAYVGTRQKDVFSDGDHLDLTLGRMTLSAGSRRLVASYGFPNTVYGFTGIRGLWTDSEGGRVQAFFTLPVDRRPTERALLDRNHVRLDRESFDVRFWAVLISQERIFGQVSGELYAYGLSETDRPQSQTSNRHLYTPGFRLFIKPGPGRWDFEVEGAVQFGTSRATMAAADTTDLDHFAGFFHGHVGRRLNVPWAPRLVLEYDYASGDANPNDGDNNRFDRLYGARRKDFGPSGIYGALTRSNISSPGFRAEVQPAAWFDGFVGYRAVWLARRQDSLITANLRDTTGASGSFVGHQLETRLRFEVLPGNLVLEIGGAYLIKGRFLHQAPAAPDEGDTTYFYSQTTLTF